MTRDRNIQEIIDSIQRTKQRVCWRVSQMPNIAVTPSQWAVLHILHHTGPLNVKDIACRLAITGSAVTQLTRDLEKKKLIKRTPRKDDRRSISIDLTPKYRKAMLDLEKSINEECAGLFAKLSDRELATLNRLHMKINDQ